VEKVKKIFGKEPLKGVNPDESSWPFGRCNSGRALLAGDVKDVLLCWT